MLLGLLLVATLHSVSVKAVTKAPKLDGIVDSVWATADSIYRFKQFIPDYGEPATYRTVVKFLQDESNLYILAVAYTGKRKLMATLSGSNDGVTVYLDPVFSRQDAYYFRVSAAGYKEDGVISDNGARRNSAWDGYWFAKVKTYPHKYVAELKIPFRSIRYRAGISKWGLQVKRGIPNLHEVDYWPLPPKEFQERVSAYGILEGIKPGTRGMGMEFYPVGLVKNEAYGGGKGKTRPRFGLDFNWNISPNFILNTTFKPDFAQIEADPFALNLSKYELYLRERRPFFIEANEIFKPVRTSFGDVFWPFHVFYSRRIGKRLPDGTEVPILFGAKFTAKTSKSQIGYMGIYTEGVHYGDSDYEPAYLWNVFRFKTLGKSTVGVLIASRKDSSNIDANFSLDGKFNSGPHEVIFQGVRSKADTVWGNGFRIGYDYFYSSFLGGVGFSYIGEKLNLNSTGYLGEDPGVWIRLIGGKVTYPRGKKVRFVMRAFEVIINKKHGEDVYEKTLILFGRLNFRGGVVISGFGGIGNSYDFGVNRTTWRGHFEFAKNSSKFSCGTWNNLAKKWNYRLNLFGWTFNGGVWGNFSITDHVSFMEDFNYWVELGKTDNVEEIFLSFRPSIGIYFDPEKSVVITAETVPYYQNKWDIGSVRLGLRFKYQFMPKSTFYIVLNQAYQEGENELERSESIAAVKIRWAIPF